MDELTVHLAEYQALKDEQRTRIGVRDGLVYATLASVAAVGVAVWQTQLKELLLAAPVAVLALGWIYVDNDQKITSIRGYLRETLAPVVQHLVGRPVFGWEEHRRAPARTRRKCGQLTANIAVFCLPAVGSVAAWAVVGHRWSAWLIVAGLELAAAGMLAAALVGNTLGRLRPGRCSNERRN